MPKPAREATLILRAAAHVTDSLPILSAAAGLPFSSQVGLHSSAQEG